MIDKLSAARGDARGSVVWRWPVLRMPLLAIPLGLTLVILTSPLVPLSIKLLLAGILVLTIARPTAGLLVAAALAPAGRALAIVAGVAPLNLTGAMATAFIAGWLLRGVPDRRGPTVGAPLLAWLVGVVLAVPLVLAISEQPWSIEAIARWADDYARGYYGPTALSIVAGLALAAATVILFRQRPQLAMALPEVLIISGAVAAVLNVSAGGILHGYHLTSQPADWIAVAGYFVMVFCVAVGMLPQSSPRHRMVYAASSVLLAIGCVSAIVGHHWTDVGIRTGLGIMRWGLLFAWLVAGLARSARALQLEPRDPRLVGLTVGVATFLVTSLASSSLFQSEIAVPFWIQVGLMMALAGSTILNAPRTKYT